MKLLSANVVTILHNKSLPKFILLYGPEEAEINISLRKVVRSLEKQTPEDLEIINLHFSSAKENPLLLRDELASFSLLANNRLIIISDTASTLGKDIIEVIKTTKSTANVIFIAGDLAKSSSTRQFFEEANEMLAIACYKPDLIRMKKIIRENLNKTGLQFPSELVESLAQMLPANELIIQNEIEKLMLYQGDSKEISIEDVVEVMPDAGEFSLDDLCSAIVKKNPLDLQKHLISLQRADTSYMLIVRVLANLFKKVLIVKHNVEAGKGMEQSVASLRPPVYFKQRDNVIFAAKKFSLTEIKFFLKKILDLELDCKKGLLQPELTLNHNLSLHFSNMGQ